MKFITGAVRPEDPLPPQMEALEVDHASGRPIPFFVAYFEGTPDFRVVDSDKWVEAVKRRLCWVCGQKMGSRVAFVGAVDIVVARLSPDPPSHPICAGWSARNCPVLANPLRQFRTEGLPSNANHFKGSQSQPKRLTSVVVYTTNHYSFKMSNQIETVEMGEPLSLQWYANAGPAAMAGVYEELELYGQKILSQIPSSDRQTREAIQKEMKTALDTINKHTEQKAAI